MKPLILRPHEHAARLIVRPLQPQPVVTDLSSETLEDHELRGWECVAAGDSFAVVKRLPFGIGDVVAGKVVTDVAVKRVQEITDEEAVSAGAFQRGVIGDDPAADIWTMPASGWRYSTPTNAFRATWDAANPKYPWSGNPWVVAVSVQEQAR